MKKTGLALMLTCLLYPGTALYSAEKLDFTTVDMLTYRCYMEKKWDSVIVVGKQALRQDIDYYYLRVRLGIAYFEKSDYFPSATHLKKARQFNSGDPYVADYLYRALVYTNRTGEAGLLRKGAIHAQADDFRVEAGESVEALTDVAQFLGADAGEGQGEEQQDRVLLAEIGAESDVDDAGGLF